MCALPSIKNRNKYKKITKNIAKTESLKIDNNQIFYIPKNRELH
jgi:hypothetical protein